MILNEIGNNPNSRISGADKEFEKKQMWSKEVQLIHWDGAIKNRMTGPAPVQWV